jgi:diguanylate cyclase (GGDEF)-like protein/PAS domain S-box-containing protein
MGVGVACQGDDESAVTIHSSVTPLDDGDLHAGEAYAHAILEAALDAVITIDHRGRVLEFNLAAEGTFGYRKDEVLGRELAALIVPPGFRDAHRSGLARWTADGPLDGAGGMLGRRVEVEAMRSDGSLFPAELAISRVDVPGPPLFTACIRDLSEQRGAEERLRETEFRYRTLVEQLPLISYVDEADSAVSKPSYLSPHIETVLGYSPAEWLSTPNLYERSIHPEDLERVLIEKQTAYDAGEPLCSEYRMLTAEGRTIWVEDRSVPIQLPGGGTFRQGFALDITERKLAEEAWRAAEEQLRHQAFHDALTGLPNRALFTDRVQHALAVRRETGGEVAALFVDLDDFKAVNDRFGHPAGDAVLHAVGKRLREAVSPSHTVARIGGDEFAVLVETRSGLAAAVDAAERLVAQFETPFEVDGREVFVTASVGIAVGDESEELLRSANVAMYGAKQSGGDQYLIYAQRMDDGAAGRMELVADLRRARVEDELVLHFQPTVELATGAVVGVEALVRWRHPRRGLLSPGDFIALAEETGRIVEIGRWVLLEACRGTAAWRRALGGAELSISVNVSPRQVRRPGLLEDVQAALSESGLDPSALTLEITESVLAGTRDDLVAVLHDVSGLGVGVALDDFGTGYSSLSLLQDLPVGSIKIDRSFVAALDAGGERMAFVQAIVDLAQALGLEVVGEGIESALQVNALRRLGCRVGQGFYFSEPLRVSELDALFAGGAAPTLPRGRVRAA